MLFGLGDVGAFVDSEVRVVNERVVEVVVSFLLHRRLALRVVALEK